MVIKGKNAVVLKIVKSTFFLCGNALLAWHVLELEDLNYVPVSVYLFIMKIHYKIYIFTYKIYI